MAVNLELTPKQKRPRRSVLRDPVVYPDIEREQAERLGRVAKALGDPIRMQLVDVLRKEAGKVCVCELVPLRPLPADRLSPFEGLARRRAGRVGAGTLGLLLVNHDALEELSGWLAS